MEPMIPVARVARLLECATRLEDSVTNVAERRHALIRELGELVGASAGFWGWGRGNPIDSTIAPVAALYFGMTADQWRKSAELSLSADGDRLWSRPIRERMQDHPHVTVTRSMLMSDQDWAQEPYRLALKTIGQDDQVASVRYYDNDCWFSVTLSRAVGAAKFSPDDISLISLAIGSIVWLQPRVADALPPETFIGLTNRQRIVMLSLLEGQSRKKIATQLKISLHTVNDHVKAIFEHFGIRSVSQLAARFLQAQ